jgi:hypothetical protein
MDIKTEKMLRIFRILSFFDKFRWERKNTNLINFFNLDLDPDTKVLTHWLCYIMDRQMPFQRIWDIGGFVISNMIFQIKEKKSLDLLNPEKQDSFVVKDDVVKDQKSKYHFLSQETAKDNPILGKYEKNISQDNKVKFKSRYLPSDYFSILNTFVFLEDEKYGFEFTGFISEFLNNNKDKDNIIKRLIFALYLITYYEIGTQGTRSYEDMEKFNDNVDSAIIRKDKVNKILNTSEEFEIEYSKFLKQKIFSQKRTCCSVRDYIKFPEFNDYFKEALERKGLEKKFLKTLFNKDSLAQLELPGDVWNNNKQFSDCILKDTASYEEDDSTPLNKIVRKFYEDNKHIIDDGYPEQFDVTFDFVPRMCVMNNCLLCPIGRLQNRKENNLEKICINNKKCYCTVALMACNYHGFCVGKEKCNFFLHGRYDF